MMEWSMERCTGRSVLLYDLSMEGCHSIFFALVISIAPVTARKSG